MGKNVAEIIVDTLIDAGAKRCWGIVGDTINHFTDAVQKSDLRWIHVRHEEAGALAAGGEAYLSGELAVCAGTCGPGSLHFVNGIFESHRNGAPVLLIASNVDRREAGLGFPQEVDQKKIYEQCSVFCEEVSHPDQTRRITAMAAQAALSQNGVAVVIVNGDMFTEQPQDELPWKVNRPQPVLRPNDQELDEVVKLIQASQKITLYAGIGARAARQQTVALADCLQAPLVHTSRAKEFIEPNNPYNVGMTGILGNKAGMHAVGDCELLILLGCNFAYTQFYPDKAKIIQIDRDPTQLGLRHPVDIGLVGDVADTIDALLPRLKKRDSHPHLEQALSRWASDKESYRQSESSPDPKLIHPQHLTALLDKYADDDAVFTADGGSPMVWLLRHLTANGKRHFLTSLSHGTMANAYPQAMGIAAAMPERQVIAMCGDGGFAMLMGDLLTLKQESLGVKLLVYNNRSLGFVEMEQRVEGLLDNYTELENPDFAKLAEVCGIAGYRADNAIDMETAVQDWLRHDGPALLDVRVNRVELVMPPEVEAQEIASTALFGIKAVLDGRGKEVISLIRDNFIR